MTAFMIACDDKNTHGVKLFLNHAKSKHIELNAKCLAGRTAFLRACKDGNTEIVKLLLDHPNLIQIDIEAGLKLSKHHKEVFSLLSHYTKNTEDTETMMDHDDILYSLRDIL